MFPNRCSVNATPQQMSNAAQAVEKFIKGIAKSKKERKPIRPHVIEVGGGVPFGLAHVGVFPTLMRAEGLPWTLSQA